MFQVVSKAESDRLQLYNGDVNISMVGIKFMNSITLMHILQNGTILLLITKPLNLKSCLRIGEGRLCGESSCLSAHAA